MDVGEWLRGLGLGQYEAAFHENEIEADILPDLTDSDLNQFGVPFGHRKRLLKAIANLGATDSPPKPASRTPTPQSHDAAERRQITVMFCDLVGSTAMSARLDPEDMREIIGAYHRCCASCIERDGGFVAKYMGDGVLAYFGYPQAHEHDAERGMQAGLGIVVETPKLATAAGPPCTCGSASRPTRSSSAISSDRGRRRSAASSARRRLSLRGCKRSPSRTRSSSPTAYEGCFRASQ